MAMQTSKPTRKRWFVSNATTLLHQYAKISKGNYVAASFKGWKYEGQHVEIELKHGLGRIITAVTDSSSDSSNQKIVSVKYLFTPRRKLEFHLCRVKRPLFLPFRSELRPASMPNSALSKQFHAKATHPSLLRTILKHEGLSEALESRNASYIKLQRKGDEMMLILTENNRKPDIQMLSECVELLKLFIAALHEHGMIKI